MRRLVIASGFACVAFASAAHAHQFLDYFDFGDASLSARGYRMTREVAAYASAEPTCVVVTANIDGREAVDYGRDLGAKRAQAVASELVALGIRPDRIKQVNVEARQPARIRPPGSKEALNRRVVVDLYRREICDRD